MRRTFIVGFALLLVSTAVAEGAQADSAAPSSRTAVPVVRLLSAGATPRSALRMKFVAGSRTAATFVVQQSIKQTIAGAKGADVVAPPLSMVQQTTVDEVDARGSARASYQALEAHVVDDGTLAAEDLQRYESAISALTSLGGTMTLSSRNITTQPTVTGTEGFDDAAARIMEDVAGQSTIVGVILPREAVGIGARWRSTATIVTSGVTVRQTSTYTLRSFDGEQIVVDIAVLQTAAPQSMDIPNLPEGATARITRWRGEGHGTATIAVREPVARSANVAMSADQRFTISLQGQRAPVVQHLEMTMDLTRPAAAP